METVGLGGASVRLGAAVVMVEAFDDGMWRRRARLVHATDADTVRVACDLGFGVRAEIDLRLAGIDAPELRTQPGEDALVGLLDLFAEHAVWATSEAGGWPLRVETLRRVNGGEVRSFARWVGRLWVVAATDGLVDVAEAMVELGHARRVAS